MRPIVSCSDSCSAQFDFYNSSSGKAGNFVQVDNLEWTGIENTATPPGYGAVYAINLHDVQATYGTSTFVKVTNNYMHGACIAEDGPENADFIYGYPLGDVLSQITGNVIDGSDDQYYSGGSCGPIPSGYELMCGMCSGAGNISDNYIGYLSNGIVTSNGVTVHDNIFEGMNSSIDNYTGLGDDHENAYESNGDCNLMLYNNIIRNQPFSGLVVFQMSPNSGCTSYAFNNLLYNFVSPNGMQCYESGGGGACNFFNNTAACGATGNLKGECGRATGSDHGNFINNHLITSASTPIGGSSVSLTTNVTMTESTATSQGYTSTQTYPYSPTAATNSTVGAGTNEYSSLCSAIAGLNATAGAACQLDTTDACTYNTSNHTMSCPLRTQNAQSGSGAWNAGAYLYAAGPNPPTNLTAVVQ